MALGTIGMKLPCFPRVFCVLSLPLKPILLSFYCILPFYHPIVSLKLVKCSHPLVNIVKSEEAWSIQKVPLFTTEAISLWNNSIYPLFYFYTLNLLLLFRPFFVILIPFHIIIIITIALLYSFFTSVRWVFWNFSNFYMMLSTSLFD